MNNRLHKVHSARTIDAHYHFLGKLKGRDFLSISNLKRDELESVLHVASHLKEQWRNGHTSNHLDGKCIGMFFQKDSTRTRISFENGIFQLGGLGAYISEKSGLQLGRGESLEDTIGVMSRYYDALVCRLNSHETMAKIAKLSPKPVVNALDDMEHPCQIIADFLTIMEYKKELRGLTLAYFGDGENNVTHSLMLGAAIMGMDIIVASPKGYLPLPEVVWKANAKGIKNKASCTITQDPKAAAKDADVIYTDTWVSMGDEDTKAKRINDLARYKVTAELMKLAKPDAIFMHDMPAYRENEVEPGVIDGPQSVILDQAENRMHVQKALLIGLIAGSVRHRD